jgi:small subunit ribosomal protein S7
MSRRRKATKRPVTVDSRYQSEIVSRLINTIMDRGKKSLAQRIVYRAIDIVNEKTGNTDSDPLAILNKAIETIKPKVEVKSRRIGGATYQVPMEVPRERQLALAMRWLKEIASNMKGLRMEEALANQIIAAAKGEGEAIRKRDDVYRMAQANRAFAHLRF